jgi:hypothetical protein
LTRSIIDLLMARALAILALAAGMLLGGSDLKGQTESAPLDRQQFSEELSRLTKICERLQLNKEAELTQNWLSVNRTDVQRLYLPSEVPKETGNKSVDSWRSHFLHARRRHAEYLFAQATQAVQQDNERLAYQLLWQVVRENPEHAEALRTLGSLVAAATARPSQKSGAKLSLLPSLGGINRWQTPNFQLYTRVPAKVAVGMSQQLEQLFVLWTQQFYELWAPQGLLKNRLSGGSDRWPDFDRIQVVLLDDRAEYLKLLGLTEKNIAVSVGYYNPTAKISIFYSGDDLQETIYHEVTHQLFSEASNLKTAPMLEKVPGAWCIEGLALYMESLAPGSEGWSVGGLDAKRLQTARYRALRDEHWPLWQPWCQNSLDDWKASSDIALNYSHAAGLTHLFLDILPKLPETEQARNTFFDYVRTVYEGRQSADALFSLLGSTEQAAQQNYRLWLTITDQQLEQLSASAAAVKHLVLSRSQLTDYTRLAQFKQLKWLDLSFTNVSDEQLDWLGQLTDLNRLSLEGSQISGDVLKQIAKLKNLKELDLSLCKVDDAALAYLAMHPKLETLWLTGTKVSSKSLSTLSTLAKLKSCDVSSTVISVDSWQEFVAKHPQLKK